MKKNVFFRALPELPPRPPIWATCTTFFGRQKRRFSAYYRTMSDNCDHNFGTFDDFGVKNGVRKNDWTLRQYVNVM